MNILVDTSVWSHALRKDHATGAHVAFLKAALQEGETIFTTGVILQELLQGFDGPRNQELILENFQVLPLIVPTRDDHIRAAALRNECRRKGIQAGTIDALIAALCIERQLTLLSADRDFEHIAGVKPLKVWIPTA